MSVPIRTRSAGRDPVARAHARAGRLRATAWVLAVVLTVSGGLWLVFGSPVFGITDIRIEGVSVPVAEAIRRSVDETLGATAFGFLRPARNILLLDESAMAATLGAAFVNLERVGVTVEYPHAVRITATERTPLGTWCADGECRYFDASGTRWGSAVPSRGPLLLLVTDERQEQYRDPRAFGGLMNAVDGLPSSGLRPISAVFPDAAPGDLRISVIGGYEVVFDALGNTEDQLATLIVLLGDRAGDPAFHPSYIDLRTPGRAYYK